MRSLSRREKMSQPRSPRWVCSMTVGMMKLRSAARGRDGVLHVIILSLGLFGGSDCCASARASSGVRISRPPTFRASCRRDDQAIRIVVGDLSLRRPAYQASSPRGSGPRAQAAGSFCSSSARSFFALVCAGGRQLGDALLHVGVGDLDALALGDRLQQQLARASSSASSLNSAFMRSVVQRLDVEAHHRQLHAGARDDAPRRGARPGPGRSGTRCA